MPTIHFTTNYFKQNVDWTKDPVLGDGMLMFRQQIGESGLLKSFCSFNSMSMAMNYDNFEAGSMDPMQMNNLNLYANTSYTDQLAEKWLIRTGVAYSRDSEKINYAGIPSKHSDHRSLHETDLYTSELPKS